MRSLSAYAFANAKIHAMLGRLLSAEIFEGLIRAQDYSRFITILKDTAYLSTIRDGAAENVTILEKNIFTYDRNIHEKVADFLQEKGHHLVLILVERYRLSEVKHALRSAIDNKHSGDVSLDGILSLFSEDHYKEI